VDSRSDLRRGRVLVTGLEGFTGQHLRPALESFGHEVVGAGAPPAFDLRDVDAVRAAVRYIRPDYVVHLAAVSFVPHGDPAAIYAINAVGSTNLLEALSSQAPNVRKVLLASSAYVYGNADRMPIDEATVPRPVNHYSCSKLSMECMARTWFNRLPVVIARPFNYTGPGQAEHFLVPKLIKHFVQRAPEIDLGNLDVVRDFSDVRMTCDAYARLLSAPARSTVINVCSGAGRSVRSLLDSLIHISGHNPIVRREPALIRETEVNQLVGSNERLLNAIGPLNFVDFQQTLSWMWRVAARPRE
jgi:nucleoside-diphosphate-sugar epimerase